MKKWIILLLVLGATILTVSAVYAQQPNPQPPTDNDVNRIAKKLYCPVCPNTPLDVCQTQACKDWRGQIRDQLAAGWSDQQIMNYFVSQYGERVLAEPERKGLTSLVWVLPVLAVLIGLLVVWRILKSWKAEQRQVAAARPKPDVRPDVLAEIEKQVREID